MDLKEKSKLRVAFALFQSTLLLKRLQLQFNFLSDLNRLKKQGMENNLLKKFCGV